MLEQLQISVETLSFTSDKENHCKAPHFFLKLECSIKFQQMKIKASPEDKASLGGIPKHERLRAYLLQELNGGRLKPGDALPTEFALATSAEVSRNTVRHALAELERGGLIRRVRGCGTFVHES